jgi:hypothetical protein
MKNNKSLDSIELSSVTGGTQDFGFGSGASFVSQTGIRYVGHPYTDGVSGHWINTFTGRTVNPQSGVTT